MEFDVYAVFSSLYLCKYSNLGTLILRTLTGLNVKLLSVEIGLKDADGMANSKDHDQHFQRQSDLGQQCFVRLICPSI